MIDDNVSKGSGNLDHAASEARLPTTGTSKSADIAAVLGILSVLAFVLWPVTIHLGLLSSIMGFVLTCLAVVPGALLAWLFGIIGLVRTRPGSGRAGRGRAWLGAALGTVLLLTGAVLVLRIREAPPIHDITTNTSVPPVFSNSVRAARIHQNGVDYPDGGPAVESLQVQSYPDLKTIELPAPAGVAMDRARRAAEQLGWKVTRVDPREGRVEAYDVSGIFMFVDDIVVRVRPTGASSIVDVRSSSRIGRGDFGRNAARIRAFRTAILAMR